MYTVLLVDDEPAVLNTLTASIPWHHFGVEPLLTAFNGEQALSLMEQHDVDLLITDIRMPGMSGLELLTQVRSLYPDTHCILLTAYGEFEYAQRAIQLGVENYLLKPFREEEMTATIENALSNIYSRQQNSHHLFRNNILSRWANGTISPEELSERASLLNINIYLKQYCAICIRKLDSSFSLSAYSDACMQLLSPSYEVYLFKDYAKRYTFIVGSSSLDPEELSKLFADKAQFMNHRNAFLVCIGSVVNSYNNLHQSYNHAITLSEHADVLNAASSIFIYRDDNAPDDLLTQDLDVLFQQKDSDIRQREYLSLASELATGVGETPQGLLRLTQSLLMLFSQQFPNQPKIQEQIYQRAHLVSDYSSKAELESTIIDLLEYSYLLYRYHFEQFSPFVQHVIEFTHTHYSTGLSIKEFCAKGKMNAAYLGYLFKKETGMFYNDYLLQYRICCAARLLLKTDRQITDIATDVGFSSSSYFITCFRKQTGLSPVKYRALKRLNVNHETQTDLAAYMP